MLVHGTRYDDTIRFDILYGKNAVYDIWDKLVIWYMGKTPYVVWYCWRYGTGKTQYVVWYVGGMVRWHGVVDILYG